MQHFTTELSQEKFERIMEVVDSDSDITRSGTENPLDKAYVAAEYLELFLNMNLALAERHLLQSLRDCAKTALEKTPDNELVLEIAFLVDQKLRAIAQAPPSIMGAQYEQDISDTEQ